MTVAAGIAFPTFPAIEIGPLRLMTFGLFVALGVLAGVYVAARRNQRFGIPRSDTERVAIILLVAGFVGARVLWVFTHLEEISSPLDAIAVWDGGLQFSGGIITALIVAPFVTRRWPRDRRLDLLDGAALGFAIGQMIGRLGCIAVGEHLGGPTTFPLGWTYTGGVVVEGPLEVGVTYHSAALYEFLWMGPIIVILLILDRRRAPAGVMAAAFGILYGVGRFLTDFVRINDERLLGLTGAQYMTMILVLVSIGLLVYSLRTARREGREAPALSDASDPAEAAPAGPPAPADLAQAGEPDAAPAGGPDASN